MSAQTKILDVQNLEIHFGEGENLVKAVDGISFEINDRETVALVGESGSGKSVSALALAKLVPQPPGRYVGGTIHFKGAEILTLDASSLRKLRGNEIAYIFQEPATSLNPVFRVGYQIGEALRLHRKGVDVKSEVHRLLDLVKINEPDRVAKCYPHELSGGMQQRVMIAMALACDPDLLIADEPTTALDVTVQKSILELLTGLRDEFGLSILLITHNFGLLSGIADRVYVMNQGKIVESGTTEQVLRNPQVEYTKNLIAAIPRLHPDPV
ncbi:MAG: ABC transporter ATP-binding protein [Kiritimatiellales bacterium]|nr:ABC transporter ATP-binding protein [Kiritimatiellales bacterium]